MGWRFHRVLSIIPGLRVNLSKSGVSTSVGPRGASVNVGRHGVTTNAGIPGTGLSYRQKLGTHGSWIGVVTLVAGLGLWGYNHGWLVAPTHPTATAAAPSAQASPAPEPAATATTAPASDTRYVRRGNSDLRAKPSTSAPPIAKEAKGTEVELLSVDGKWSQVRIGGQVGWMRSSVLGIEAP